MKRSKRSVRLAIGATVVASAGPALGGTMEAPNYDWFHIPRATHSDEAPVRSVGHLDLRYAGSDETSLCSATLIDQQWVLTAGHCVRPMEQVTFRVGGESRVIGNGGHELPGDSAAFEEGQITRGAESWYMPEDYAERGGLLAGNDIALARLNEPIENHPTAELRDREGEIGKAVERVGFGATGTGRTGAFRPAGVKRAGRNIVDSDTSPLLEFGGGAGNVLLTDFDPPFAYRVPFGAPYLDDFEDDSPINLEYQLAGGDSGGPDFINGEVAGVHSFGTVGSYFFGRDGSTRVSSWHEWIQRVMASVDEEGVTPEDAVRGTPFDPILEGDGEEEENAYEAMRNERMALLEEIIDSGEYGQTLVEQLEAYYENPDEYDLPFDSAEEAREHMEATAFTTMATSDLVLDDQQEVVEITPEPASLALLTAGGLLIISGRRDRRGRTS
jgi:hypothetical protein